MSVEELGTLERAWSGFRMVGGTGTFIHGNRRDGYAIDTEDCLGGVIASSGSGACCFDDNFCEIDTPSDCAGFGGTYQGDDTTCEPNPCPGVCCLPDGTCHFEPFADCEGESGIFQSSGTCGSNLCCPTCGTLTVSFSGILGCFLSLFTGGATGRIYDANVFNTTFILANVGVGEWKTTTVGQIILTSNNFSCVDGTPTCSPSGTPICSDGAGPDCAGDPVCPGDSTGVCLTDKTFVIHANCFNGLLSITIQMLVGGFPGTSGGEQVFNSDSTEQSSGMVLPSVFLACQPSSNVSFDWLCHAGSATVTWSC